MGLGLYRISVISLLSLAFSITLHAGVEGMAAGDQPAPSMAMIVRSNPTAGFETRQTLHVRRMIQTLSHAVEEDVRFTPPLTDVYITFGQDAEQKIYRLEPSGSLWDEKKMRRFVLPKKAADQLLLQAKMLRRRHYGEMIPWEKADAMVASKSYFSIKDLNTGLSFRVQRRAGRDHADMQPVTSEDSKIMKRIYDDHWSWRRKAIIVESDGRRLAASMNGMPHGGDGIPDNGFAGHFCIHFLNSTTHRSGDPDLLHQLMVHKAAGQLREFLQTASPISLVNILVEAMKERDSETVRLLFEGMDTQKAAELAGQINTFVPTRMIRLQETADANPLTTRMEAELEIGRIDGRKERMAFEFIFIRPAPYSPWHLQDFLDAGTPIGRHG